MARMEDVQPIFSDFHIKAADDAQIVKGGHNAEKACLTAGREAAHRAQVGGRKRPRRLAYFRLNRSAIRSFVRSDYRRPMQEIVCDEHFLFGQCRSAAQQHSFGVNAGIE